MSEEMQEPPMTFQHVIGEQQIQIIMLQKELQNAQKIMEQQQELLIELRASLAEKDEPTPIKKSS